MPNWRRQRMITPKEIKEKALRKFKDFLCFEIDSFFGGSEVFFPLIIRGNTGNVNDELLERQKDLQLLINNSKQKNRHSYCLDMEIISSRKNGNQSHISKIYFENKQDYLKYTDEEECYNFFWRALNQIKSSHVIDDEFFKAWAKDHTKELCEKTDEPDFWANICLCVDWLNKHQNSNLYIREIALSIHTKFIENNKSLIKSLSNKADCPETFERSFGLKEKPNYVRFRILDESVTLELKTEPITECSITLEDFKHLNNLLLSQIKNIFVVENEMVYLTFPKIRNAICLYGGGYKVNTITDVAWFESKDLYYFGDLDEHGFDILSSFRESYSNVRSFCMSESVWNDHLPFTVEGKKLNKTEFPKNLNNEETSFFRKLQNYPRNRLEQERISLAYIVDELKKIGL